MGTVEKVMICSIKNQIRYYGDIIRDLKMDAANYTKPNYNGDIPEMTAIEREEYNAILAEIDRYAKLKCKEEEKLKKLA